MENDIIKEIENDIIEIETDMQKLAEGLNKAESRIKKISTNLEIIQVRLKSMIKPEFSMKLKEESGESELEHRRRIR